MASREIELATRIYEATIKKKTLEDEVEAQNIEKRQAEAELTELLLQEGKNSTGHINGIGELKLIPKTFWSVPKAEMPGCIEVLKRNGHEGMVKEIVEPYTLKSFLDGEHEQLARQMEADDATRTRFASAVGIEDAFGVSVSEIAAKCLEQKYNARSFTETKLSFTKRGK